jgi:hypothetical protein
MEWENEAMVCHKTLLDSPYFRLKQNELMGIAYLKSERDHVVGKKFSLLASFDGRHRAGKSLTAATVGYLWDSTFWDNFENRIVQDHQSFMNALEYLAKSKIEGGVIVVDEAGVSMGSSDWYERWMKVLTDTVQMFGYLYPVVLFVAPVKDFVDSRLRKMFHVYYKVARYDNDSTTITPYNVKYNTINNKWFYKKPVIRIGGQEIQMRRLRITKPPAFLVDRYRNLELSRKSVMLDKFMGEMRRSESKDVKKERNIGKVIDFVERNYKLFESKRSKPQEIVLDENTIEYNQEIPHRLAKYVKTEVEKKMRDRQRQIAEEIARKV